jgi:Sulfotransferase family
MAVHILHVRKTAGTAMKFPIKQLIKEKGGSLDSPYGEIVPHPHGVRLDDVPDGDLAVFAVRDPVTRYVSGFYSRLHKGAPRYNREWSDEERRSFEWFSTPQELADALSKSWGQKRKRAEFAMNSIRHLKKPLSWWTGTAQEFRQKLPKVLFVARQEHLDEDWARMKQLLALPGDLELPSDPKQAHRSIFKDDKTLTPKMVEAVKDWYEEDYRILGVIEEARGEWLAKMDDLEPREAGRP